MRGGQSLIEILIGLTIGALLIGASAMGIAFMLRSTSTNDNLQMASGMAQSSIDKIRAFSGADWQNIYGLTKGTSTSYYLAASSTQFIVIEGKEGVVGNDVVNGLVGRWGFDEATGTIAYDFSGNNYYGVLINDPAHATSTCKVGYCLSFDGMNDYVSFPNGLVQTLTAFTISGWFYWIDNGSWSRVFDFGTGTNVNMFFTPKNGSTGTPRFAITTSGSGSEQQLTASSSIPAGNWHHFAITRSGSIGTLYVDGESVATNGSMTLSPSSLGNTTQNWLGRSQYSTDPYFSGLIDDIRIYTRALSAGEVKQLYGSPTFSRYFTVEDVCRMNDASSTISGVTPCGSGSVDDPSTQKVTSVVEWVSSGNITNLALVDYITRWKNAIFQQTDWFGGPGDENIYTQPGTTYASSTNIDLESGAIRLHNL